MKKLLYFAIYSITLITLFGCVIGKKVPYEKMKVDVNYSGTKSIALAVYDQREMIISGSRKPDFVGYQMSDIGVAWPMGTKSGKNYADVIEEVISQSYKAKGYTVTLFPTTYKESYSDIKARLMKSTTDRRMIIKVNKLQIILIVATMMEIDVDIEVFDQSGNVLVTRNFHKNEKIANDLLGTNYPKYAPAFLEKEITSWLNDDQIAKEMK